MMPETTHLPRLSLSNEWCPRHGEWTAASTTDTCPRCDGSDRVAREMDADWNALVSAQRASDTQPTPWPEIARMLRPVLYALAGIAALLAFTLAVLHYAPHP